MALLHGLADILDGTENKHHQQGEHNPQHIKSTSVLNCLFINECRSKRGVSLKLRKNISSQNTGLLACYFLLTL